jgi:hypothetical protein
MIMRAHGNTQLVRCKTLLVVPDENLRRELIAMIEEDDRVRARLAADGSLFRGYHPEMEALHRRNAARLRALIEETGWPRRSRVGEDGASAAWRIVQHAIGEPEVMRACLLLLEEAAASGEADQKEAAMLVDRVRVLEGRAQLYGTQYDWDATGSFMALINGVEDVERVEERRRAVGLPPIEWRRRPPPDEPPPEDHAAREREMLAWARRVGWR